MEACFAESHAAPVKHNVITIEKAMGRINRYLQLTTVMAAKQRAKAHNVTRMTAKVSAGRPPSCHARIAENGESRVYVLSRKAAEEQQRFDKRQMPSCLPPGITPAGATTPPRRCKLYHYPLFRAAAPTYTKMFAPISRASLCPRPHSYARSPS